MSDEGELELERQLATLTVAAAPLGPGAALQAAAWWNALARLGVIVPLAVVHDIGELVLNPAVRDQLREQLRSKPTAAGGFAPVLARYRAAIAEICSARVLAEIEPTLLRDEVVAALLLRLLGDIARRAAATERVRRVTPLLPLASGAFSRSPAELARLRDPSWVAPFLELVANHATAILVRLEQTELAALRLLGLLAPGGALPEVLDLYRVLDAVKVGAVAEFSLELMPSLLETKRASSSQRFAVDGYASVERRGTPDALLPSELAQDPAIFEQRALGDELLFYGHERPHERRRRVHGLLVDASASMRGVREVFARGLGLALAKKLQLVGAEVWFSFFDSQLHRRVDARTLGGRELPYLLGFRSERGRNYGRAFEELRAELARPAARAEQDVAITFITHAECRVPVETIEALSRLASLYGVFVLPSRPLDLPYLPLLRGYQVVTVESLAEREAQRRRALEVVNAVIGRAAPAATA